MIIAKSITRIEMTKIVIFLNTLFIIENHMVLITSKQKKKEETIWTIKIAILIFFSLYNITAYEIK